MIWEHENHMISSDWTAEGVIENSLGRRFRLLSVLNIAMNTSQVVFRAKLGPLFCLGKTEVVERLGWWSSDVRVVGSKLPNPGQLPHLIAVCWSRPHSWKEMHAFVSSIWKVRIWEIQGQVLVIPVPLFHVSGSLTKQNCMGQNLEFCFQHCPGRWFISQRRLNKTKACSSWTREKQGGVHHSHKWSLLPDCIGDLWPW